MTYSEPDAAIAPRLHTTRGGLRVYYLDTLAAGPLAGWDARFAQIAALGFSHVLLAPPFAPMRHGSVMLSATHDGLHPDLAWAGSANAGIAEMVRLARGAGLQLLLDVVPERAAGASPLAVAAGSPFCRPDTALDPRGFDPDGDAAHALLGPEHLGVLARFWGERLRRWSALGVHGFRLTGLQVVPAGWVRLIADALAGRAVLIGWMPGVERGRLASFVGSGLDYVCSSLPWWDGRADWYWHEDAALRRVAPVIAPAESPFGPRAGEHAHDPAGRACLAARQLTLAALLGTGWMAVDGCEHAAHERLDPRRAGRSQAAEGVALAQLVRDLNAARIASPALAAAGGRHLLSSPGAGAMAVLRCLAADPRLPDDAALIVINLDCTGPASLRTGAVLADAGGTYRLDTLPDTLQLAPGAHRVFDLPWRSSQGVVLHDLAGTARRAAAAPRIAIEQVTPSVDDGRFPARRCLGEQVTVQADIICDGHEQLAAVVRWRAPYSEGWHEAPMRPLGNDRWHAAFPLLVLGVHHFVVEAWKDVFATYRDELDKKFAAGLDVRLELEEGLILLQHAARRAGPHAARIEAIRALVQSAAFAERIGLLLSDATAAVLHAADARAHATRTEPPYPLEVERLAAQFASWYEIFPRSMSGDPARHGTFADVAAQLPRIRDMGFDVLYFPPIHPIGRVNRKGPNNTLTPGPGDPGSPYGIADHTGVHRELGTLEDFRTLCAQALEHGLEIALDFAVQCAPDHPWLTEHRGWFDWRPDGSIRYAENPPKKYQDIVNVDFYRTDAVDSLWRVLCEVVLLWCDHGVRIFRVDNPHTKPLPFWHWMITTVRARYPDVLFLAEAFTKPKMMYRLAKVGFSQSYTYFTWRNTRAELQDYLVELTTTAPKDFFRPNFFVNTPDINPPFLQTSGRPGHLIRAALAATLAGLWGVYCGFELCEATPLPGREEYLDSEKYQLRAWDWDRPGNIVHEITALNWIRRLNPALHTHLGVTFLDSGNDQVIWFEKATEDRSNVVLIAITLDPGSPQQAALELPLWRWQERPSALHAEDLIQQTNATWDGGPHHVRLDPGVNPYAIWRVRPV